MKSCLSQEPTRPVLCGEVSYEGHMQTNFQDVQRHMFWSFMLSGAAGHTYGAAGVWHGSVEGDPGIDHGEYETLRLPSPQDWVLVMEKIEELARVHRLVRSVGRGQRPGPKFQFDRTIVVHAWSRLLRGIKRAQAKRYAGAAPKSLRRNQDEVLSRDRTPRYEVRRVGSRTSHALHRSLARACQGGHAK